MTEAQAAAAADEIDEKLRAARPNGGGGPSDFGFAQTNMVLVPFADMREPNLTANWVVKDMIPTGGIILVYGEPGSRKTFFVLELALRISCGHDFFGRKTKPGPGARVVYAAAEAGPSIRNRVAGWARENYTNEEINFAAIISPVNLCDPKANDIAGLINKIRNADVLVIDTVSRALAGGDENSAGDMGEFVKAIDKLRAMLSCTVIIVHHVGKDSSRGARGHSLLRCAVDTEVAVERRGEEDEGVSVATVTKQRDGPGGLQIAFTLRQVELGIDQDGDPVTTCVVEPSDYAPSTKPKGPTGKANLALEQLNQAVIDKCERVFAPGLGREVAAVPLDTWREYMLNSKVFGEGNTFRSAWKRAQDVLSNGRHIGFTPNGYVYPTKEPEDLPF